MQRFRSWMILVVAYGFACMLPAIYLHGFGAPTSGIPGSVLRGYEIWLHLPFVMLAIAWWANPILFLGIAGLNYRWNRVALACGAVSTLLALSVLIFGPCPPDPFQYSHLHSGYYVWLGCMVGLLALAWMEKYPSSVKDA